jgi:hypothetical protein
VAFYADHQETRPETLRQHEYLQASAQPRDVRML